MCCWSPYCAPIPAPGTCTGTGSDPHRAERSATMSSTVPVLCPNPGPIKAFVETVCQRWSHLGSFTHGEDESRCLCRPPCGGSSRHAFPNSANTTSHRCLLTHRQLPLTLTSSFSSSAEPGVPAAGVQTGCRGCSNRRAGESEAAVAQRDGLRQMAACISQRGLQRTAASIPVATAVQRAVPNLWPVSW